MKRLKNKRVKQIWMYLVLLHICKLSIVNNEKCIRFSHNINEEVCENEVPIPLTKLVDCR